MKNILILIILFFIQIFPNQLEDKKTSENLVKAISFSKQVKIQTSGKQLKKFEGIYQFAPGNEMKIYIKDSTLKALLPGQPEYTLIPSVENVFILKELSGYKMSFNLDENKKIISVTSNQPNGDFTAQKISDAVTPPKEEKTIILPISKLKKFEGEYEFVPGNDIKIYLKDGNLKAFLKGQPEYTLLPVSDKEFVLKNMSGYKMIFEDDENGEITAVISSQPNGEFRAKKLK